jgi:putative Mg2+ transporter-C (MgtC) family protein
MSFWDAVLNEITREWPGSEALGRIVVRLTAALVLTGLIGWEREVHNKTAGLRTHLLVALGSCLFILAAWEAIKDKDTLTRVIQGIAPGIGFIGAGAIIKHEKDDGREVRGLTTASSIWMAAAIGVCTGLGHIFTAILAVVLTWVVLVVLERLKERLDRRTPKTKIHPQSPG